MSLEKVGGGGVIVEAEGPLGDPNGGDIDTWTTVASLNTARFSLAAASDSNGLIYAIGGKSSANERESSVEQYDPSTDTWTTVASLGTGRKSLGAASGPSSNIYAIGGETSSDEYDSVVEQYDPSTDTWTTVASLGTGRKSLGAASNGDGLIYAIGGEESFDTGASTVEKLTFFKSFSDVYSATGDTLFAIDDPNGTLKNRTTGEEVTGGDLITRDTETVAAFTEIQARVYRTEET